MPVWATVLISLGSVALTALGAMLVQRGKLKADKPQVDATVMQIVTTAARDQMLFIEGLRTKLKIEYDELLTEYNLMKDSDERKAKRIKELEEDIELLNKQLEKLKVIIPIIKQN